MNVKSHHPLQELLAQLLHGIETVPTKEQRAMVQRACKAAADWHDEQAQSLRDQYSLCQLGEFQQRVNQYCLDWRGIENPCKKCGGAGVRAYGSTSGWRGGFGGQMITNDVCDGCWGSGSSDRSWLNLKRLSLEARKKMINENKREKQ